MGKGMIKSRNVQGRKVGRAPKRRKENLKELSRSIGNLYISNKKKGKEGS